MHAHRTPCTHTTRHSMQHCTHPALYSSCTAFILHCTHPALYPSYTVLMHYPPGIDDMQELPSLNPSEVLSGSGPSKITLLRPGAYGCEVEHISIFDHKLPAGEPATPHTASESLLERSWNAGSTPHTPHTSSASTVSGASGERLRRELQQHLTQEETASAGPADEQVLPSAPAMDAPTQRPAHRRSESSGTS
jgi:hypothetical protein